MTKEKELSIYKEMLETYLKERRKKRIYYLTEFWIIWEYYFNYNYLSHCKHGFCFFIYKKYGSYMDMIETHLSLLFKECEKDEKYNNNGYWYPSGKLTPRINLLKKVIKKYG